MSMQSPTDSEAFYEFLGQTLSHGDRETPPESLLRKWRAQREYEETVEAIREGMADIEAGRCRPFEEFAAEMRKKFGIVEP
jgi:predicted transcriptional regulator